jgi:hypothetical protein
MSFKVYVVNSPTLHLGGSGMVLKQGQKVESDGMSAVRINGQEITVPAFSGAIKAGWVTEEGGATLSPQKSGSPTISKADGSGERVKMRVVEEEENRARPIRTSDSKAQTQDNEDEVVVARIGTPAKSGKVEVGKEDRKVKEDIEKSNLKIERLKVATGDVEEATSGELLEDLLPNASVAGRTVSPTSASVEVEPVQEPEVVEPLGESQVREAKAEVLKVVYPDVDYNFDGAWRSRARVIFEAFEASNDTTMLAAFMSIESQSVVKEVNRRIEKASS